MVKNKALPPSVACCSPPPLVTFVTPSLVTFVTIHKPTRNLLQAMANDFAGNQTQHGSPLMRRPCSEKFPARHQAPRPKPKGVGNPPVRVAIRHADRFLLSCTGALSPRSAHQKNAVSCATGTGRFNLARALPSLFGFRNSVPSASEIRSLGPATLEELLLGCWLSWFQEEMLRIKWVSGDQVIRDVVPRSRGGTKRTSALSAIHRT